MLGVLEALKPAGAAALLAACVCLSAELIAAPQDTASLLTASMNGRADQVRRLLAAGVRVNATGNDGATALMAAANGNHPEVVQALVAAGANVNAAAKNGVTALMLAAERGAADIV